MKTVEYQILITGSRYGVSDIKEFLLNKNKHTKTSDAAKSFNTSKHREFKLESRAVEKCIHAFTLTGTVTIKERAIVRDRVEEAVIFSEEVNNSYRGNKDYVASEVTYLDITDEEVDEETYVISYGEFIPKYRARITEKPKYNKV